MKVSEQDLQGDPEGVLRQACGMGRTFGKSASVKGIKGSVWLKATSKEASGQFPAVVSVNDKNSLDMEITNLIGGTEATLKVRDNHYLVQTPGKKTKEMRGQDAWSGIPLQWATDLFLGRIPCPVETKLKTAKYSVGPEERLIVKVPGEEYRYHFRKWSNQAWVDALEWRHTASKASVTFEFDEPENSSGSPLRWSAESKQGEVKVRWQTREALN